jgi:hypothetical protein
MSAVETASMDVVAIHACIFSIHFLRHNHLTTDETLQAVEPRIIALQSRTKGQMWSAGIFVVPGCCYRVCVHTTLSLVSLFLGFRLRTSSQARTPPRSTLFMPGERPSSISSLQALSHEILNLEISPDRANYFYIAYYPLFRRASAPGSCLNQAIR